MIKYTIENEVAVSEFRQVLLNSTLGERRPVEDQARLGSMLANANLIVTARTEAGVLVGIARSVSDFVYCTYLSDLAVDQQYQHQGIGKKLIEQTKLAAPLAKLILLSAPKAVDYYPKIGFSKHDHCFFLENLEDLNK